MFTINIINSDFRVGVFNFQILTHEMIAIIHDNLLFYCHCSITIVIWSKTEGNHLSGLICFINDSLCICYTDFLQCKLTCFNFCTINDIIGIICLSKQINFRTCCMIGACYITVDTNTDISSTLWFTEGCINPINSIICQIDSFFQITFFKQCILII